MTGALIVALFAVLAALMYARLLPALLAVPLMALAIGAVASAGAGAAATLDVLGRIVNDGSVALAPVFVTVILGATLGRVTMETGIAERIVNVAAEFGGDQPFVLALALCAAVAALFTSLTGLGAIIMVGSIVLPIMMTVGVPRRISATLFLLAYALGFVFNLAQWQFYQKTFGVAREQMQNFGFAVAALEAVALIVYAVVRFRRDRGYATWALSSEPPTRRQVPTIALLTPILPLILYFVLHASPIGAFAVSAVLGALVAKPAAAIKTLVASAVRGTEDVAPAILLFMGIGMLLAATHEPSVRGSLEPLVGALAPRSPFAYVVLFGGFSWLALYRGPLNPYGVGILVYTVLAGLGVLPPVMLVAAIMAVVQVQNVCDPTNTQNVWVANFTGVKVDEIMKLTLPYQVGVALAASIVAAVFAGPLLHVDAPFGAAPAAPNWAAPAEAAPAPPREDLYAAPVARRVIAVGGSGPFGAIAAHAVAREIVHGWRGYRAVRLSGDPSASICRDKTYAAVLRIVTDRTVQAQMPTVDSDLYLDDCAGWPVDEFHTAARLPLDSNDPEASANAVSESALSLLFRVRLWTLEHPKMAENLFERGLAVGSDVPRTPYFFSFFKSPDGNMRVYVRPGGPAWFTGLRTMDIVDKVDRRWWWEYGTYQTQLRAYDGKPHTIEAHRGSRKLDVSLDLGSAVPNTVP